MSDYYSKERLAAYIAIFKTSSIVAHQKSTTVGKIAEEVLQEVEKACGKGELSLRIGEFERDPDACSEA